MRSTELRLRAGGVQVTVVVPAEHAGRLATQWSWCLAPTATPATSSGLALDETLDVRSAYETGGSSDLDVVAADYEVTQLVTRAVIEALAGRRLMLHAAGLTHPDHGLLVLVAPSGTGKTTAARALARCGLGYLSDETVVLGAEGYAAPYPKPLSVVLDGDAPSRKQQHSPDEVDLAPPTLPTRAGRVVLLERDDEFSGPPQLCPVPTIDALVDVIPQTSALARLKQPLTWLLNLLDRCGGAHRLRYREVHEAVDPLRDLLADPPGPPEPVEVIRPTAQERWNAADGPIGSSTDVLPARLRRGRFTEAVDDGERLLVLVGSVPAVLAGLGRTIWLATATPASAEELLAVCEQQHGQASGGNALVSEALRRLMGHGLLVDATTGPD